MTQGTGDVKRRLRLRARILLLGAIPDVILALAAFVWGDRVLPAQRVPGLELTLGQCVGAAFVLAAAVQFLIYSRLRSRIERVVTPKPVN